MRNSTHDTEAKASRVQVGKLPQPEKELKDREAENVKGGGGLSGGVVADQIGGGPSGGVLRQGGEEIPQTTT